MSSFDARPGTSNPQTVHVSPSTCQNLTLFKDILKEYRRLDDGISTRINRANAAARAQGRASGVSQNPQDQACLEIWRELVENWKSRTRLINYCVSVVDQTLDEKRKALEETKHDATSHSRTKAAIYADENKRRQVRDELYVEPIIRHRAMTAFRARCQFFEPPVADAEGKQMWEEA